MTYFSQAKLDASFKKGTQGPRHAFFDVCDRLLEEAHVLAQAVRQWVIAWQARFFRYANQELDRYKKENQVLFYDDLLLKVRDALQRDRSGRLRHLLRARYKAALIDEFQDTDMVQYTIFAHLFDSPDSMMLMIGDPKQAIYSFRGADIFTYLRAARNAGQRFTLTQNWRSTPGMVQAVNTLFGQHPHPFLWPAIQFYPATAAVADRAPPGGDDPSTPLTIWFLDNPAVAKGRRALNKKTASACICHAVAREVRRCVAASGPKSDGITYQDVAILVRTNRQAGEVKNAFAAARIPAVVYNAGSVFHRPEALDLRRVLAAVADPGSEVKLRTALTTRFFGRTGQELNFNDHVPIWWEETIDRFFRYRAMWSEGGFIRMFRRLLIEEKAAPRLLAGASGERYLTNILHLSELLHQTAVEQGKGVGELIQWLDQRRQQTSDTADAHQTRLESDDDAVTILTIHKSKGLEFPVVFCPFSWEGLGAPAVPALFHDRERDDRRVLDLGSDEIEHHLAVNAEEGMAEALRLLYVAVTRAKRQCYLVWGPLPSAAYSAPVYLMYGERDNGRNGDFWAHMQASARDFQRRDSRTLRRDMTALARRSDGAIAVVDMPDETTQMPEQPDQPMVSLASRRLQRKLTSGWRIASFSSLIHGRHEESEIIDDAAPPETVVSGGLPGAETANAEGTIGDIAGFEASARAGLFFHDLLERIDFTAPARANWRPQIEDLLQAYGFDPRWRSAVLDMLRRVIRTPLEAGPGASFALDQISHDNRLNELEFHLPLAAVDAASLGHAFAACRQPAFQGRLPALMEELNFQLSGGYLKGFIDLVLRHDDRYYIVDWKSNFLGDTFEAYRPARLAQVMEGEYYFLQYHIYLLAWDQYMRTCYPDYQYERDFGGVYYLFIRGMEPSSPSSGLFFDRPGPELLQGLRRTLLVSNQ